MILFVIRDFIILDYLRKRLVGYPQLTSRNTTFAAMIRHKNWPFSAVEHLLAYIPGEPWHIFAYRAAFSQFGPNPAAF